MDNYRYTKNKIMILRKIINMKDLKKQWEKNQLS